MSEFENHVPIKARTFHGTGEQAIEWVLHINRDLQEHEFLTAWQQGDAEREWPEFYEWLDRQPATVPARGPFQALLNRILSAFGTRNDSPVRTRH